MSDNPYSPPASHNADEPTTRRTLRGAPFYCLLLAFFGYCMAVERWVNGYGITDLMSTGSIPPLLVLLFLIGSASLMVGIGQAMYFPWLGKRAFLLASVILACALAMVHGGSTFAIMSRLLFGCGIAVALLGVWVVGAVRRIMHEDYAPDAAEGPP